MTKWKITNEKEILSVDLFKVYNQHVKGPGKYERDFTIVRRRPTVSVIPLTSDNYIYLVRQFRYLLNKYTYEFMAGYVEEGEDILKAAQRELLEETGIKASSYTKLAEIEMSATGIRAVSHLFLARDLKFGAACPEEGEYITIHKVSIKDAVKYVLSAKINSAVTMAGVLMLDKLLASNKL